MSTIEQAVTEFWPEGLFGVTDAEKLRGYCWHPRWVARGVDSEGRYYLKSNPRPGFGVAQPVPDEVFNARPELPITEMEF